MSSAALAGASSAASRRSQQYQVLRIIGEGAYGVVLKCRNRTSGECVAIKKFRGSYEDNARRKAMQREVKVLKLLRRHPNIVRMLEAFKRKGKLHVVFEYIPHNLLEVLQRHPTGLKISLVKHLAYQLCAALNWCHSFRIVHRDIKPENILVDDKHIVKLCDFGFARTIRDGEELTDYVATRWYRAPELVLGCKIYDETVDVWAMACILGELVDGQPLFPGDGDVDQLHIIQNTCGRMTPAQLKRFFTDTRFAEIRMTPNNPGQFSLADRYTSFAPEGVELMERCLNMDPHARPSSEQCLGHIFFNDVRSTLQQAEREYYRALQEDSARRRSSTSSGRVSRTPSSEDILPSSAKRSATHVQTKISRRTSHQSSGSHVTSAESSDNPDRAPEGHRHPMPDEGHWGSDMDTEGETEFFKVTEAHIGLSSPLGSGRSVSPVSDGSLVSPLATSRSARVDIQTTLFDQTEMSEESVPAYTHTLSQTQSKSEDNGARRASLERLAILSPVTAVPTIPNVAPQASPTASDMSMLVSPIAVLHQNRGFDTSVSVVTQSEAEAPATSRSFFSPMAQVTSQSTEDVPVLSEQKDETSSADAMYTPRSETGQRRISTVAEIALPPLPEDLIPVTVAKEKPGFAGLHSPVRDTRSMYALSDPSRAQLALMWHRCLTAVAEPKAFALNRESDDYSRDIPEFEPDVAPVRAYALPGTPPLATPLPAIVLDRSWTQIISRGQFTSSWPAALPLRTQPRSEPVSPAPEFWKRTALLAESKQIELDVPMSEPSTLRISIGRPLDVRGPRQQWELELSSPDVTRNEEAFETEDDVLSRLTLSSLGDETPPSHVRHQTDTSEESMLEISPTLASLRTRLGTHAQVRVKVQDLPKRKPKNGRKSLGHARAKHPPHTHTHSKSHKPHKARSSVGAFSEFAQFFRNSESSTAGISHGRGESFGVRTIVAVESGAERTDDAWDEARTVKPFSENTEVL